MKTLSTVVQQTKSPHSLSCCKEPEGVAHSHASSSSTENDLDDAAYRRDIGTVPVLYKSGLGTVVDNVLAANDIIYLKSDFVHYPQPLIY